MIYTKTGDKGTTSLASGQRVAKTDARIETYGTADELNSFVGLLKAECEYHDTKKQLNYIQNKLFNLGAFLSEAPGEWITEADGHILEGYIDAMQLQVPPQRAFVLPAGNRFMALSHVCRTITRRLERKMVALAPEPDEQMQASLIFVNRLSDYFFVLARWMGVNCDISDDFWVK